MSRQLDPVAELETLKTHVDHSGNPSLSTLSQRSQSGEASKRSPSGSPRKENEGEHSHHKKSLFSKMKDKAKKLQHSLSTKKRHDEEGDATMSPFSRFEDHEVREGGYASLSPRDKSKDRKTRELVEEEEEDPEYLGAPMYESKKAPEELKKTAMQHPRENPVITETNVLSVLPAKHDTEQEQKDCTGSSIEHPVISEKNVLSDVKQEKPADSDTTTFIGGSMAEKTEKECTSQEPISPSKTVTETVTEKLAPAYAKVSDATNAITKKIQDMAFPESTETEEEINDVSEINTAGTNQTTGLNTKVWDKGVSMKEYISQKFEPSEDDRELSRVISKAISPRKASSQATSFGAATTSLPAPNSADNKAPLLANTNEIVEEENHGKILQPN
ncbi:PREDICTED: low-temperature-induced 65 kDa protein-like [Camelina sativa]|uniref:Low-temperature-induced 65 kDa protein-like n=1 Tax=Camelina sativa TaxID=90675 RepID=A0ABM0TGK3_CAMSA|nr:PREDICTED: low-temperature-induced 65 kDa protein-like [Camelina sativa]